MTAPRILGSLFALTLGACATAASPAGTTLEVPSAPMAPSAPTVSVHETVVAAATGEGIDRGWLAFRDGRDAWLGDLSARLVACESKAGTSADPECVRRSDTFEIGYALTRMYKVTRDPLFLAAADASVSPKALAKASTFDTYTSTWFLAMVTEREALKRSSDLHATAVTVAANLEAKLNGLDDYSFAQGSMFGTEDNLALALHSLWRWAEQSDDAELLTRLTDLTKRRFLGEAMDSWCPMPIDGEPENSEFLPPCLQRAVTVLTVAPDEISNPWLAEFLPQQIGLEPIVAPRLATHGTLNFSRAVALWSVYQATGDTQYRRMYVSHIGAQMKQLEAVRAAGGKMDPWQAAFGIYAISLSHDA